LESRANRELRRRGHRFAEHALVFSSGAPGLEVSRALRADVAGQVEIDIDIIAAKAMV
jgi:hypothetical protein